MYECNFTLAALGRIAVLRWGGRSVLYIFYGEICEMWREYEYQKCMQQLYHDAIW